MLNRCPRCKQGKVWRVNAIKAFIDKNPMNKHCPNCNLKYERELGFWQGAMLMSYLISVLVFILCWIIAIRFIPKEAPVIYTFFLVAGAILLVSPFSWRWSRLFWLNFFTDEYSK
ncbi:MAG: DUF983 domain-containing protein [Bacteroidia bacterium]|nr:DUF983 domain-containing protein [Bacteroidia bacterium]